MKKGFTLIELAIVLALTTFAVVAFFIQKSNFDAFYRDEKSKTAINTIYYALENYFYKTNGYYPTTINETNLPIVEPSLWTDPHGFQLGDLKSSYHYTPADCQNDKCSSFILSATLEKEDPFIKSSPER